MSSDSTSFTPSPPVPSAHVTPEPCIRNPRIHRQSGIPSITRTSKGTPNPNPGGGTGNLQQSGQSTPKSVTFGGPGKTHSIKSKVLGRQKMPKIHHELDLWDQGTPVRDGLTSTSASRRRYTSMPSDLQAQIDIDNDCIARGLASSSPPLVDFTHFEDMYRGPRIGAFEGLVPYRNRSKTRNGLRSSSGGEKSSLTDKPRPVTMDGRSTASLSVPGTSTLPASARKPDPRLIIASLRDILGTSYRVEDYLNSFELLAAHQLDQLDFEERDAFHASLLEKGKIHVKTHDGPLTVLGEPIRKASIYSSTYVVLGGREHCLPIIVVNCIEELYRTGIYQPHLFRSLPNRARLFELIGIFNSEVPLPGSTIRSRQSNSHPITSVGFGINTSLHLESTPDICALLTTYLSSLPEPILPSFMFRAIWDWCELDDDDNDNHEGNVKLASDPKPTSAFGRRHGLPSTVPLARTYTSPTESTHILVAQLLLQLLPSPNFSLIIYLLAFFSQVALVKEENGVGVEDLSRMFGGRIFGGGSVATSTLQSIGESKSAEDVFNTTQTRREGEAMMSWFLRRWGPISEGLFDVVDDAKMGLFKRTMARKDSLGHDILTSWLTDTGRPGGNSSQSGASDKNAVRGGWVSDAEEIQRRKGLNKCFPSTQEPFQDIPQIRLENPQDQSTPKSKAATVWVNEKSSRDENVDEELDIINDYVMLNSGTNPVATTSSLNYSEDATIDIARVLPSSGLQSGPATSPDERLMDISLPAFFNETYPTSPNPCEEPTMVHVPQTRKPGLCSVAVQTGSIPNGSPSILSSEANQISDRNVSGSRGGRDQSSLEIIITALQKQLKNRSDTLEEVQKEMEVCKKELDLRARRIAELERSMTGC
uniref:Rho-GAP domain-containing protein n=1 Tax=Psilocybe cubensis TaxID=181762 RepID=A0A8H8CQH4_PSICU